MQPPQMQQIPTVPNSSMMPPPPSSVLQRPNPAYLPPPSSQPLYSAVPPPSQSYQLTSPPQINQPNFSVNQPSYNGLQQQMNPQMQAPPAPNKNEFNQPPLASQQQSAQLNPMMRPPMNPSFQPPPQPSSGQMSNYQSPPQLQPPPPSGAFQPPANNLSQQMASMSLNAPPPMPQPGAMSTLQQPPLPQNLLAPPPSASTQARNDSPLSFVSSSNSMNQPPMNQITQPPPNQFQRPQFPNQASVRPPYAPPTMTPNGPAPTSGYPMPNQYPSMSMNRPPGPGPQSFNQAPSIPNQPPFYNNQGAQPPFNTQFNPAQPTMPPQPQLQQPQFDQYQQQQQQQQNNRIDMDQIPNPIEVMQGNNFKHANESYETNEAGKLPPLANTDFICKDAGNCNPRFIRSSMNSIPNNPDLLKQSKLPIALCLTPFSELRNEENEPPVSDLGDLGPVRCKRCKAYMSPFMQFIDNGKRFQCPFCEDTTTVPQEYFNHLDHMGKRVDYYERPELCLGSYELVATKEYCHNSQLPSPPAFIFMIDVSCNSVRNGLLHVLCPYIKNVILPNLPRDYVSTNQQVNSDIRVGFVTYDKELHFYNLKSTLVAPQMMIVSDIDEVFVPILDGFLVNLNESKQVIDLLLDQLPIMFENNKETELILGPVIEAGVEALKSAKCCGKLFVFHSNLPNALAQGQLKNRDGEKRLLGTDKEKNILSPQSDYYANLGKKCVENQCSLDLFLLPNQYCDIASISDLTRKTSGQIYKYDFFQADTHGKRLCDDLKYSIDNTCAFDAVMKVRTSTGIKPIDYIGNFNLNVNDVELAGLSKQTSLCVELKHEDKLNENTKVYIQLALLYTSLSGQRRIRIHNLSLNVCTQYSHMFASCDIDALINYMSKLACRSVTVSTPKSIRENLINQVANILACYRRNCTNQPSKGQFILPETLKLLPVFSNSVLKSDAIAGSQNITLDDRSWLMYRLMSMDPKSTYVYFYPRLVPVNDVEDNTKFPSPIRCLYERIKDENIYLLENGLYMYLWIGSQCDPNHVQNLFGVSSVQQLNVEKCKLLEIDTPISINIRSIIKMVQDQRKLALKLVVVRQRDSLEVFFKNLLVEDKGFNANATSYVEYLHYLHREVKNLIS